MNEKNDGLSLSQLKRQLRYSKRTGLFHWKDSDCTRIKSGTLAGYIQPNGYVVINIGGRLRRAHRLAWLYITGSWPKGEIDHIDENPSNNRFSNLRDVARSTNRQNVSAAYSNNLRGLRGVSKIGNRFTARINFNKVQYYLGCFSTAKQAHAAYLDAKTKMGHGGLK